MIGATQQSAQAGPLKSPVIGAHKRNQLFVISSKTWAALDADEVAATAKAMKEYGIYNLPYPVVDLHIGAEAAIRFVRSDWAERQRRFDEDLRVGLLVEVEDGKYAPNYGPGLWLSISELSLDGRMPQKGIWIDKGQKCFNRHGLHLAEYCTPQERDIFADTLIVLLNTRNVVKSTKRDKLAALGIGKKSHRHEYVTTISLPTVVETAETEPSAEPSAEPSTPGTPKAPHLRRGHIRRQRFGPKREFVKQIWVEPIFVNADKDWVDKRERYNVSL